MIGRLVSIGVLAVAACRGSADQADGAGKQTLELAAGSAHPALKVSVEIPPGWTRDTNSPDGVMFTRVANDSRQGIISFGAGCGGDCKANTIAKDMDAALADFRDAWSHPGAPAQFEVATIDQGTLTNGKFIVVRATLPPTTPDIADYMQELGALCEVHPVGAPYFVRTIVHLPIALEADGWPALLAACKATTVEGDR